MHSGTCSNDVVMAMAIIVVVIIIIAAAATLENGYNVPALFEALNIVTHLIFPAIPQESYHHPHLIDEVRDVQ